MSSSVIRINLQPRTAPCHAVTRWYSESALLVCSFEASSLRIPSGSVEASSMTFDVEYDVSRIASIDVGVRVLLDAARGIMARRFGDFEAESGRWGAIADTVFVRVDDEQSLSEIRFANVQMV